VTEIKFLNIPTVVICTEPDFEWKSRLLVRSIRRFGGRMKDATIVSYSPRQGLHPSAECLAEFSRLNVHCVSDDLNKEFPYYGLANKACAMADAEVRFPGQSLLFLDSDKVVLREPSALLDLDNSTFAARPVDMRICGAACATDPDGDYWEKLYNVCNVRRRRFVATTMEGGIILEYFNSGMVFAHSGLGVFSTWLNNLRTVWYAVLRPNNGGDFFVEQTVLSATVSARCANVFVLPNCYNIPVHLLFDYPEFDWERTLGRCISLHYHNIFASEGRKDLITTMSPMLGSERSGWLSENLMDLSGEYNI